MIRGSWHQCGHNSQVLVGELLQQGVGVGAILSPKDLSLENAADRADEYRAAGGQVLLDPQFYAPDFADGKLPTYPTLPFRKSVASLHTLPTGEWSGLTKAIQEENKQLGTAAIIAPAVPYEASRPDIVTLNAQLFAAAKSAADALGKPTYANVVLGQSATAEDLVQSVLSNATALAADGWYYTYEFGNDRLPLDDGTVYRYCSAGLTLACTGKPVLHACAGPMANLAFGAGARAAGIGIWQNLWGFSRSRYQTAADGQGGGGDAPPRYFSSKLWGTIVYPDELLQLTPAMRAQVLTPTPHSKGVGGAGIVSWSKRDAQKHLVQTIIEEAALLSSMKDARKAMQATVAKMQSAIQLHDNIKSVGIQLKDKTDRYQAAWAAAGTRMLANNAEDYDWLEMNGGP